MANEHVVTLTKENFKSVALKSDKPVLVDFWAAWCGPCRMVAPLIDELAEDYAEKAIIAKLNVDDENEIAMEYKVMSIPTLILFKNGAVADKFVGARPKGELEDILDKYL